MLREQWVITLALTPLTLLLFGQVSMVGLIANALAIPWITLLVTPLAMMGVLLPALWDLDAAAIAALSWYLQILAGLPFATVSVAQAPIWAGAAGVVGGVLLAMKLPWSLRLCGLPLLLPVLLWQSPRPLPGQFELLAADIGQGNAVIVRTASHALLYDAGPRFSRESDAGHRVLVPLLRALDTPLDLLVLSHRDSDHTGGALAVLKMQASAGLLSSIEDDHELQAVRQARRCVAGQRWRWDGVDFEVLHPAARDYEVAAKSNAMSCMLRISTGTASALLVGDIEQAQEARLVFEQANEPVNGLKSDLLLVPHHGSKSSSSAAFLDAVQPRFALVQAGYRNRFGHPAEPVLVRYRERNIQLIDSPHCGAFTWESAQPQTHKCQRAEGSRYWQHVLP
jgi:competence protein ComEC